MLKKEFFDFIKSFHCIVKTAGLCGKSFETVFLVECQCGLVVVGDVQAQSLAAKTLILHYCPAQQLYAKAPAAVLLIELQQAYPAVARVLAALYVQLKNAHSLVPVAYHVDALGVGHIMLDGGGVVSLGIEAL